jgi:hypothetical protein
LRPWRFLLSVFFDLCCAGEWQKVCPSGGPPYEYETEGEAWAMARMCYPDQIAFYGTVRVVKAEEKP